VRAAGAGTRRRAAAILLSGFLAGCAAAPRVAAPPPVAALEDVSFEAAGRLSARHGDTAVAASFRWSHRSDADELVLATPFGEGLARLTGDASGVALELPDGRTARAADWESLTGTALGVPVPVRGLAWWVRGVPHSRAAHTVERDAAGRMLVLRQDGWEIVFGYRDDDAAPSRLVLAYPQIEIRLAVDARTDGARP
jgi:outer membrane lipoprotein LolB